METCVVCDGELTELGTLGNRLHLRCRQCGSDQSVLIEPKPKGRIQMTEALARAASQDAGNRSMKKSNRTSWSREDYNEAVQEFNRLWPEVTP